jgi:hypothetical protein
MLLLARNSHSCPDGNSVCLWWGGGGGTGISEHPLEARGWQELFTKLSHESGPLESFIQSFCVRSLGWGG